MFLRLREWQNASMSSFSDTQNWRQLEAVFQGAVSLRGSAREEALSRLCGTNQALRQRAAALLASTGETLGVIAGPIRVAAQHLLGGDDRSGSMLGPWRLLRVLGSGGMGCVYLAERADQQYKRNVAIKLLHPFVGSNPQFLRRFARECQILATLNHPNIAMLFDSGFTEDGLPFVVMEYVDGVPVDIYCRQNSLSTTQRLRLFGSICGAVSYAHRNLVVHGDIKPANVLVKADGQPKLLDFGVAQMQPTSAASCSPLTLASVFMTPAYASPERARGEPLSISADIYALGVLLAELVIDKPELLPQSEDPPSVPSFIASFLKTPTVHRDLVAIVRKSTEPEASNRYPSVSLLYNDIAAHLSTHPVSARNPGRFYRTLLFIRRNTAVVVLTNVAALTLLAFAVQAQIASNRARAGEREAQAQAEMLESVFNAASAGPYVQARSTLTKLLEDASARVLAPVPFRSQPAAALWISLAKSFQDLRAFDQSLDLLHRAYGRDLRSRELTPLEQATVFDLAALNMLGQADAAEAEHFARRALQIRREKLPASSPPVTLSLLHLGQCLAALNRDGEAEGLIQAALQAPSLSAGDRIAALDGLSAILRRHDQWMDALNLFAEATRDAEKQDRTSAFYVHSLAHAADLSIEAGTGSRYGAALRQIAAIEHSSASLPADRAIVLIDLSLILVEEGQPKTALDYVKQALTQATEGFDTDPGLQAQAWSAFSVVEEASGNLGEAEDASKRALDLAASRQLSPFLVTRLLIARSQLELDRRAPETAEQFSRRAIELEETSAKDTLSLASAYVELGLDRLYQHDYIGAESLLRRSLAIYESRLPAANIRTLFVMIRLAETLALEEKWREGEGILDQARDVLRRSPAVIPDWLGAELRAGSAALATLCSGNVTSNISSPNLAATMDPRFVFRPSPIIRLSKLRAGGLPTQPAPQATRIEKQR